MKYFIFFLLCACGDNLEDPQKHVDAGPPIHYSATDGTLGMAATEVGESLCRYDARCTGADASTCTPDNPIVQTYVDDYCVLSRAELGGRKHDCSPIYNDWGRLHDCISQYDLQGCFTPIPPAPCVP